MTMLVVAPARLVFKVPIAETVFVAVVIVDAPTTVLPIITFAPFENTTLAPADITTEVKHVMLDTCIMKYPTQNVVYSAR